MSDQRINCFWFRRDLRLHDNKGLYKALSAEHPVMPVFIFDTEILDDLGEKDDPRVGFIFDEVINIRNELRSRGSDLWIFYGKPAEVWKKLLDQYTIDTIFTNRDYEPYATQRDEQIIKLAARHDTSFKTFKDQVILEAGEVLKDDGDPYVVFTPFSRKWLSIVSGGASGEEDILSSSYLEAYPSETLHQNFFRSSAPDSPALEEMGFKRSDIPIPSREVQDELIRDYDEKRDYPALKGTSRLGIHLRFGTVSIRDKVKKAIRLNDTFLDELIWREFYSHILAHYPRVVDEPFRKKYRFIEWRNNEEEFEKWCRGQTGFPIVDAGMRQLNQTGFMHNRVRMIVASFLTKDLLVDWRWGEAYFAKKLLDYELASNNGGWQWAAGTGTDAAPYFRIFNPELQAEKYDPDRKYRDQWVPEWRSDEYVEPMVDHKEARERCLKVYKAALDKAG